MESGDHENEKKSLGTRVLGQYGFPNAGSWLHREEPVHPGCMLAEYASQGDCCRSGKLRILRNVLSNNLPHYLKAPRGATFTADLHAVLLPRFNIDPSCLERVGLMANHSVRTKRKTHCSIVHHDGNDLKSDSRCMKDTRNGVSRQRNRTRVTRRADHCYEYPSLATCVRM